MKDKIALITGGSRGLGKEMAIRLAEKGADIVITYVSKKEAAEEVVKHIEAKGCKAAVLKFDANDIKGISDFVNQFREIL
ncbi:MAG TPA: SDR family NAD(P)-dependent oxidoreductase, partial [Hanamia sp.]|nr:SDR family NAD(P)-dependent oxidoreductase [Hanamia sp.]